MQRKHVLTGILFLVVSFPIWGVFGFSYIKALTNYSERKLQGAKHAGSSCSPAVQARLRHGKCKALPQYKDYYVTEPGRACPPGTVEDFSNRQCEITNAYLVSVYDRATSGDVSAQRTLAKHYLKEEEDQKALRWFAQAALQRDLESIWTLGMMVLWGTGGVEVNRERGFELIAKAAEHDFAPAMLTLGVILFEGSHGVEMNRERGFGLITKAAEKDYPAAQFWLGISYLNEEFLAKDRKAAIHWLIKAQQNGHEKAEQLLQGFRDAILEDEHVERVKT